MQDAAIVSRFQRARDLDRLADRFRRRNRTAQWLAVDELEDEIARPDVVQLADMRMVQRRDRPRFMFESAEAIRVMGHWRGENFDGDVAIKTRIAGAVDFAHPARAEQGHDLIRSEPRAGCKSQLAWIIRAGSTRITPVPPQCELIRQRRALSPQPINGERIARSICTFMTCGTKGGHG